MLPMKTVLQVALHHYENRIGGQFKPDRRFYNKVEINPKRFGQLLRGEKAIFGYEAKNLSTFFDIPLDALCTKENPAPTANRAGFSQNA
jgi:hypothetical protein